jgi:hypothetical protein
MPKNSAVAVILLLVFLMWLAAIIIGMKMVNKWVHTSPQPLVFL